MDSRLGASLCNSMSLPGELLRGTRVTGMHNPQMISASPIVNVALISSTQYMW